MKIILFIVFICIFAFSKPNLYSSLSSDVEKLSLDCQAIKSSTLINNSIKHKCSSISSNINVAFKYGYKLDTLISKGNSVDRSKSKKYLNYLRKIQKEAIPIIKDLNQEKRESIAENNIPLFTEIIDLASIKLNRQDMAFMDANHQKFKENNKYKIAIKSIRREQKQREAEDKRSKELESLMTRFETAVNNKKFKKARKLLYVACEKGSNSACNKLAEAYRYGYYNIKRDSKKAVELFKAACRNSSAEACLTTAILVRKTASVSDSIPWYEKACNMDSANACAVLGNLYERRDLRNISKAKYYYSRACYLDHAGSCYNLGALYWNGNAPIVQPEGIRKARPYFIKACRLGLSQACYKVSVTGR